MVIGTDKTRGFHGRTTSLRREPPRVRVKSLTRVFTRRSTTLPSLTGEIPPETRSRSGGSYVYIKSPPLDSRRERGSGIHPTPLFLDLVSLRVFLRDGVTEDLDRPRSTESRLTRSSSFSRGSRSHRSRLDPLASFGEQRETRPRGLPGPTLRGLFRST